MMNRLQKLLKRLAPPQVAERAVRGQSMVEYVLIAVLVVLAIGTTIVLTQGAIGNIFSNTVYNLVQDTTTPYATLSSTQVNGYASAFAAYQRTPSPYITNTPSAPTCTLPKVGWEPTGVSPNNGTFVPC